ncbi:DUF5716 family protein [Agathobacter sp.]
MVRRSNPYYIGIDISDNYAMVSFLQLNMKEPETVSTIAGSDVYRIPLIIARRKGIGQWFYGDEARKMAKSTEMACVDRLLKRAINGEKIVIDDDTFMAEDLLALFIKKVMALPAKMGNPAVCDKLVICLDRLTKENMRMFANILPKLGINSKQFMVIDRKESFYYFALNQEKSLWTHNVFLFGYENHNMRFFNLGRDIRTTPQVVTIDESRRIVMDENSDMDIQFKKIINEAFEKQVISTVYLVGDEFGEGWMKQSLSVLCRGRRVFMGNNLFSKGACYAARSRDFESEWPFVYMGENEMKFNLSLKVKDRGELSFYNLISAGSNWFEAKGQCEVIISGSYEVDFWKQLPKSREARIETLELTDMPLRPDRATRIRITATPVSDDKIDIEIKDLGFGEIYRSSNKVWHYEMTM